MPALVTARRLGARPKFLFFWSHSSSRPGLGPHCLSQWYPHAFSDTGGRVFSTAEHYMMWRKADLFGDTHTANAILAARTPGEAKSLGRRVAAFNDETWGRQRWDVVVTGATLKFAGDPELRDYLVATRRRVLVEASPLDRIWGIGLPADAESAIEPEHWRGLNLLGFALMEARSQIEAR